MAPRPPERILNEVLSVQGFGGSLRRKLAANKERNWMLAVVLNGFAKFAAGAALSDLEQAIVTGFRESGYTDDQIRQHGALYQTVPQQVRDEIFSRPFAALDVTQSYSSKDVNRDGGAILTSVLSMPNVIDVDVAGIHAGTATLRDFAPVPKAVAGEHSSQMLIAVEEDQRAVGVLAVPPPAPPLFTIKAESFRCNIRANDSIFDPSNEPYWIFGTVGGGLTKTTISQIFHGVDSGESFKFLAGEGCIWGQNCGPQDLPNSPVGTMIQLWENDEGNVDEIAKAVAAAFKAAGFVLSLFNAPGWALAVLGAAGAVVQWFMSLMDDDHIADQVIVFNGPVLAKQLSGVGSSRSFVPRFTDGDADYQLHIRATRTA